MRCGLIFHRPYEMTAPESSTTCLSEDEDERASAANDSTVLSSIIGVSTAKAASTRLEMEGGKVGAVAASVSAMAVWKTGETAAGAITEVTGAADAAGAIEGAGATESAGAIDGAGATEAAGATEGAGAIESAGVTEVVCATGCVGEI